MRWIIVSIVFILSACNSSFDRSSPYPKLIRDLDVGPDADAVFVSVEDHARCAGFHRAFAQSASGIQNKAEFYDAAAADSEVAAVEIATSKISKELAADMVQQLAKTHAARWAYVIEIDAKSDAVQAQADQCFELAAEQEEIIREVVKAKYGFQPR